MNIILGVAIAVLAIVAAILIGAAAGILSYALAQIPHDDAPDEPEETPRVVRVPFKGRVS